MKKDKKSRPASMGFDFAGSLNKMAGAADSFVKKAW